MPATKPMKSKLHYKLSVCLEKALADFEKVEKDKKHYVVNMGEWHNPSSYITGTKGKCAVCLSGSVIAKTFKKPVNRYLVGSVTEGFSRHDCERLTALNCLRQGLLDEACTEVYGEETLIQVDDIEVATYEENPEQFKKDMKKIVKTLKAAGV